MNKAKIRKVWFAKFYVTPKHDARNSRLVSNSVKRMIKKRYFFE